LDDGVVPWHRPWKVKGGIHRNLNSKRPYRGVNQMLLDLTAMVEGYKSPYWLTYKGAEKLGGQVRKGEKSTLVVFWKRIKVEDKTTKDEKFIAMLRYFRVFNAEQVDGIEDKLPAETDSGNEFNPIEACESIVQGYDGPEIRHGGDRACYSPPFDFIGMPEREQFDAPEYYYGTLFHELGHSTGHKDRLNREGLTKLDTTFGDETYSQEELVAEITAAFLCTEAGIDGITFNNSTAYIDNWRRKLNTEPKLIVQAAAQAQKASDMILGVTFDNDAKDGESN
jgi:antirestriction protein ArdC